MASVTITSTKTDDKKVKDKNKEINEAASGSNIDEVLEKIKEIDNTCAFGKCKTKTANFAIQCKYCNLRFCTSHGLPEIHGCGEAVRRDEKRKYMHPEPKLSENKHEKAATKLSMKLKQMQMERKAKQYSSKGKNK
ncbi:DNA-binding protein SMUBP-2 [Onthophagus taurus]|uniref:DNA-binding protein SMUBP-2 n=1 Tax=Onthophagus taurus TaxID=166361 RepID=UPI0039BE1042